MKLLSIAFILGFSSLKVVAESPKMYAYWVEFTDKANTTYSIDKPNEFLSDNAINRRVKNSIAITEQDIPVNINYINELAEIEGVTVWGKSKWFNAALVMCEDDKGIIDIQKLGHVKSTKYLGMSLHRDLVMSQVDRGGDLETLEDTDAAIEAFSDKYYGEAFRQIEMLNGIKMHKMGFTGAGTTVAVIDDGFYRANQLDVLKDLYNQGRILGTWDFMARDTFVYEDDNHGMAVLSCMGSNKKGRMVGTSPDASFFLLRTENVHFELPIEQACWVFAAEYADSAGVDVINSSLGYYDFDENAFDIPYAHLDGKTTLITKTANIAASKGIVVCIAAGNEGSSKWKKISVPGDAMGIITVGAVDKNGSKAGFSSYGPTSDGRPMPNVMSMGKKSTVAGGNNTITKSNGTSFASPILCGMVACLVQANPLATSAEIVNAVQKSGDMYPLSSDALGYGIPDFYIAHIMLGNAGNFDYTKTQLVEVNVGKDYLVYNLYSNTDQTLTIDIVKKGKSVYSQKVTTTQKSFTKNVLQDVKALNRKGDYTFYVKDKENKVVSELNFSL